MDYRELLKKYMFYAYEDDINKANFTEEEWEEIKKLEVESEEYINNDE